ncbi:protein SOB FIVE-LIKE 5-like [Actinidia eriantha]|uniref:protein SOB FIVE-LIKE 5-like n=1 Tax=Actinidia eriantha TaxID=165200 RepID=UPI00258AF76D|nr:protein SOB FIVE-LIKE 5-like [Actinidia eriantha]XP_057502053.1 protein SOB FIVE-LIKE 5-like [Actinidia eriantha]
MNNDMLHSECSSGCESGWTLYLEQSFLSPYPSESGCYSEENRPVKDEDEEEDLSMISDASSGPPIYHEDHQYFDNAEATLEKNREINRGRKAQEQASFLDDTASSPIFDFSQKNITVTNHQASMEENILDFSEGCSPTHFGGSSEFHEPFGFFQSSICETQLHQNQWFGGKRWG